MIPENIGFLWKWASFDMISELFVKVKKKSVGSRSLYMCMQDWPWVSDNGWTGVPHFHSISQHCGKVWVVVFKHKWVFFAFQGQYDGVKKPMPEYHIKVVGFDQRVSV